MTTPLQATSLGGGIWRIKWNPFLPDLAAAACMHNHFCILSTHLDSAHPVEVVSVYKNHTSLAYGIDWCRESGKVSQEDAEMKGSGMKGSGSGVSVLASCSFYDHSLHIWNTSFLQE